MSIEFKLSYEGGDADDHTIDFYDVAQGLIGFQRSLAITTHLIVNGKIITQAPFMKGAEIFASPPKEGSWEICATIVGSIFAIGKLGKDSPIGHLMHSAYDYIISEALGFHVDYDKSLGEQYEEIKRRGIKIPIVTQSQFDSAVEKCEVAVKEMHRPIYAKETANQARITSYYGDRIETLKALLDIDSYEFIKETITDKSNTSYEGRVSMYNANTFKGRIYAFEASRPIPFVLAESARTRQNQIILADSLATNVKTSFKGGNVKIIGRNLLSKSGRLKGVEISEVEQS